MPVEAALKQMNFFSFYIFCWYSKFSYKLLRILCIKEY